MSTKAEARMRALPPAHSLLEGEAARALLAALPRDAVRALVRAALDEARGELARGELAANRPAVTARIERALGLHAARARRPRVRRVLNATGVLLHTNLGRAPLGAAVLRALAEACRGYAALEYDLDEGARGHRDRAVAELCVSLLGCEDALVVNNCAAAVLLAGSALAQGREVVLSRGELVEIGGGFRVPEVLTSCGARLVEVGTTNRTRIDDYRRALTPATALLMKVHRSNFALRGFTCEVALCELAALGRERGVPLVYDLGSGWLLPPEGVALAGSSPALPYEPGPREALAEGADLVLFSGDKLLGGPQAGVIAGRADLVRALRTHPLTRALRPGRLVVAALEAVLRSYAAGRAHEELPVLRALREGDAVVRARAERLRELIEHRCPESGPRVEPSVAAVGGGSMPEARLASYAVVLRGVRAEHTAAFTRALRTRAEPPVITRVIDGRVALDARALGLDIEAIDGAVGRSKSGREDELFEAARGVAEALAAIHQEGHGQSDDDVDRDEAGARGRPTDATDATDAIDLTDEGTE